MSNNGDIGVQVDNERAAIFVAARKFYTSPNDEPVVVQTPYNGKGNLIRTFQLIIHK